MRTPPAALVTVAFLAVVGCSKEPASLQRNYPVEEIDRLSDAFDPDPEMVEGLLERFHEETGPMLKDKRTCLVKSHLVRPCGRARLT